MASCILTTMKHNKTLSVKIASELYSKLKALANREDKFIGSVLNKAVRNYLISKKIMR